jgi:hypothetical protein
MMLPQLDEPLTSHNGPEVLVGHSSAERFTAKRAMTRRSRRRCTLRLACPDAGEDFGAFAAKYPNPPSARG